MPGRAQSAPFETGIARRDRDFTVPICMRRAAALKQWVAIREAIFESHTLDYGFPMVHEAVPISLLESAEETAAAGIARGTRDLFQ